MYASAPRVASSNLQLFHRRRRFSNSPSNSSLIVFFQLLKDEVLGLILGGKMMIKIGVTLVTIGLNTVFVSSFVSCSVLGGIAGLWG